jgi:hypothetical protein
MVGQKFCTSCQRYREVEGGQIVQSKGSSSIRRWKCAMCIAGKSTALYKSKETK